MRPPESLRRPATRRRRTDDTPRLPTPATCRRRRTCFGKRPPRADRTRYAPELVVGRARLTVTSASTVPATVGHGGDGLPTHAPASHTSPVVQTSPSSQGPAWGVCVQPLAGSHASSVHGLPSSQPRGPWPAQVPSVQVSSVVQASPSSQGPVFRVCPQPVRESHVSSVHGLPSSQLSRAPVQEPPVQVSPVVHASPSSQGAALGVCTQPVSGRQASSVQTLPS